jgi:hypothetical protein
MSSQVCHLHYQPAELGDGAGRSARFVGDTTAESRANWIAALDRLAALNPKDRRRRP